MNAPRSGNTKLQTARGAVKVPASLANSGSPLEASSTLTLRRLRRLLAAAAIVSLIGVGVAATIGYVHSQIDALGERYVSFCNVNDSVNCDRVLASSFAKFAGIPVSHFALLGYLVLAALFAQAARTEDATARGRLSALAVLGVIGAFVFSVYMALVSSFVLHTVCLLCLSLYAVALVAIALVAAIAQTGSRLGPWPIGWPTALAASAAAAMVASGAAWASWPRVVEIESRISSLAEARETDPDFFEWYTALPKGAVAPLVRSDQASLLDANKVVIVDFFDLECGHCRHNYGLLKQLAEREGDRVQFLHRHFPLDATCNDIVPSSVHPDACRAAEAVECAGRQGKLEEMLDLLFQRQGQLFYENLLRLADKLSLDAEAFRSCLDRHETLPRILEDTRAGAKLGITSTPTVYIGGRRIKGTLDDIAKYQLAVAIETFDRGETAQKSETSR